MDAVATPEPLKAPGVETVILPSKTLKPIDRVGIYHGMYLLRMIEALDVDYPAVAWHLGEHRFQHLVADYVTHYPSRSYTLNRLGDEMPEFIAAQESLPRRAFLHDLARLELAMTQAFDEEESPAMPSDALTSLGDVDVTRLRFQTIAALRLVAFEYDVNAFFTSFRNDEKASPRRAKTFLIVHRQDYSVYRTPLTKSAHSFLASLRDGLTVGEALDEHVRRFHRTPSQPELFSWFRDWTAAGLFRSITVKD